MGETNDQRASVIDVRRSAWECAVRWEEKLKARGVPRASTERRETHREVMRSYARLREAEEAVRVADAAR